MQQFNDFLLEFDEDELTQITNVYNAKIEVLVTLNNGFPLKLNVITLNYLQSIMEKEKSNFCLPNDCSSIIVKKIDKKILEETIQAYFDYKPQGYLLNVYYFMYDINESVFRNLQLLEIERFSKLNLLLTLSELESQIKGKSELKKAEELELSVYFEKIYKYISNLNLE